MIKNGMDESVFDPVDDQETILVQEIFRALSKNRKNLQFLPEGQSDIPKVCGRTFTENFF
jgi:hypothetical protein